MNRLLLWSSESDGDLRGQSRLNRGSYFFLKKKRNSASGKIYKPHLRTKAWIIMPFVPLLATIRVEWTTSDSTHGTCECLNLFEKQNKIAGGTYNPKDICETLSTEFISFREPGVQKQGQKSLSLPGAMERGDTAPWPQRDTGRKEGRWTGRTAGRAYRGGDRWSRSPLLSSPARRGSRAEAERHPASESD